MLKMSNTVTLLVFEDDGSETYYRLTASHKLTLSRIHAKKFKFTTPRITCDDHSINVDIELASFLHRFRYGRYTLKWEDIAERIKTIEADEIRCLPHEYWIELYH